MYLNIIHTITNLWKFELKLQKNNGRKNTLVTQVVCFQVIEFETSAEVINYFFLKYYVTSEGAVSHKVVYCQQLSVTRYQVSCYAYNYFE